MALDPFLILAQWVAEQGETSSELLAEMLDEPDVHSFITPDLLAHLKQQAEEWGGEELCTVDDIGSDIEKLRKARREKTV